MKTLLEKETDISHEDFGPDPILMKKKGMGRSDASLTEFKKKIRDRNYVNHAIDRIAVELMHHLVK